MPRLIDADALLKAIGAFGEEYGYMTPRELALEISIVDIVGRAHTIDAEPVRHGQNVTATHPSDMFVCSECGFTCEITELRYGDDGRGEPDAYEYDCKFCPDCGAKMDKRTPEEENI